MEASGRGLHSARRHAEFQIEIASGGLLRFAPLTDNRLSDSSRGIGSSCDVHEVVLNGNGSSHYRQAEVTATRLE